MLGSVTAKNEHAPTKQIAGVFKHKTLNQSEDALVRDDMTTNGLENVWPS